MTKRASIWVCCVCGIAFGIMAFFDEDWTQEIVMAALYLLMAFMFYRGMRASQELARQEQELVRLQGRSAVPARPAPGPIRRLVPWLGAIGAAAAGLALARYGLEIWLLVGMIPFLVAIIAFSDRRFRRTRDRQAEEIARLRGAAGPRP